MPLTKFRAPGIDQVFSGERGIAVRAARNDMVAVAVWVVVLALGMDIASRQWFAAICAAWGHSLDIAARVIGLSILDIEAFIPNRLMAGGAKKVLWMPDGVEGGDILSLYRLTALPTDQLITHKQAFVPLFDLQQDIPIIHEIAFVHLEGGDGSGYRRLHRNLHFHRFQHDDILVNGYLVPGRDQKFQHDARHIRYDTLHCCPGVPTPCAVP